MSLEIAPPSFSNHSRYGTFLRIVIALYLIVGA
jgi:hypothetical protein